MHKYRGMRQGMRRGVHQLSAKMRIEVCIGPAVMYQVRVDDDMPTSFCRFVDQLITTYQGLSYESFTIGLRFLSDVPCICELFSN